jgi:hypothetical protein
MQPSFLAYKQSNRCSGKVNTRDDLGWNSAWIMFVQTYRNGVRDT